jgi:hypothetical protein
MTIEIEKRLTLINPTMESQGIKTAYVFDEANEKETEEVLNLYLEIYFQGEGEMIKHSRSYVIEEGVTEENFINNHALLSQF